MPPKKKNRLSIEEIKALVEAEVPYTVGSGTSCVVKRTRRMKELMKQNGHKIDDFGRSTFDLTIYNGGWDD